MYVMSVGTGIYALLHKCALLQFVLSSATDFLSQNMLLFAVEQHILMLRRVGGGQHKACALHLRFDQPTAGCWDPCPQQAHNVKSYCIVSGIS